MTRILMLVAVMLAATAAPALAQPRGSWDETCRRAEVRGNTLSAECRDRDGRWNRSSIRYTDCAGNRVANRDGRLVCEAGGGPGGPPGGGAAQRVPGDWDESCRNAEVRGNVLSAQCRERDGGWNRSSIRFTDCPRNMVANNNGRLVCSIGGGGGGGGAQRVPGDWDQSCRDADVRGSVLSAVCRTTDGNWRRTSIRYTDCPGNRVRNENGWLVCGQWSGWRDDDWRRVPGSWDDSCRDASIRGGILTATCRTSGGRWERSSIAYRECPGDRVRNADGRLVCEGRPGGGGGGLIPGLPGIPGLR
ncbi:MAG: CVNH domain-containing protein [Acetobacteraceae bacterium]